MLNWSTPSISEKAETSRQPVDALAVKAQDVRRLTVALKKCQVNEKKGSVG